MTKIATLTFTLAINAIAATIGLGLAANASGQLSCNAPSNGTCGTICISTYEAWFVCCSTWGSQCCSRQCNVLECFPPNDEPPPSNPNECPAGDQIVSTTGTLYNASTCQQGNYCVTTSQGGGGGNN
jgi:hypothetical protein